MKVFWDAAVFLMTAGLAVAAALAFELFLYADRPMEKTAAEKPISISVGQRFGVISNRLRDEGIIEAPWKFALLARIKRYDQKIQAGEYLLSPAMTPSQILLQMVNGDVILHRFTIPEGYTLRQIAEVVGNSGLTTEKEFLDAATDKEMIHQMGITADSLEGYLFPDTYLHPRGVTPQRIVSTMVERFHAVFKPEWRQRAQALGMTMHQVVTLASIIEKETGAEQERSIIASVFHNRLKKGMRLESDPTVIYGIRDFDGNLTRNHLATTTAYNTYKIHGLPPGPIANPGIGALEAALFPETTNYFYFVSKKDGTHQFTTNYKDHVRAVKKYQLSSP